MRLVKVAGITAATVIGVYVVTWVGVWVLAGIVDLRTGEDLEDDDL